MSRKNIIFDSQILNAVQLCALRTDLNFNKNLLLPEKSHYLEEGDLLHQMFEVYNLELKIHGTNILYDDNRFKQLQEKCQAHGEAVSPEMNISPNQASEVLFQFEKYTSFTRMDGVEILEAEKPFIIELYKDDDLGIFYTGKIDRVTKTPGAGDFIPRDYKSARRTESPSSTSNQFSGYAYFSYLTTGESIIFVDKVGFQKTLTPEERFRSYRLDYTVEMLERWKANTIWWGRQYAYYLDEDIWPENRTSCDKYAGCQYLTICEARTEESRIELMKSAYIVGDKWDPTDVLRKDRKRIPVEVSNG